MPEEDPAADTFRGMKAMPRPPAHDCDQPRDVRSKVRPIRQSRRHIGERAEANQVSGPPSSAFRNAA
jgi:hypothetical protein